MKKCLFCDEDISSKHKNRKYCSSACLNGYVKTHRKTKPAWKNKLPGVCVVCSKKFLKRTYLQKTCCMECRVTYSKTSAVKKEGSFGYKLRFSVLYRDGFRCCYCGRGVKDGIKLVVDHVKPRSRGGSDSIDNFISSCEECNIGKSNIIYEGIEDYAKQFNG